MVQLKTQDIAMGSANSRLSVGQMLTHFRVVGSLKGVVPA